MNPQEVISCLTYIYIYIYIERERERQTDRQTKTVIACRISCY